MQILFTLLITITSTSVSQCSSGRKYGFEAALLSGTHLTTPRRPQIASHAEEWVTDGGAPSRRNMTDSSQNTSGDAVFHLEAQRVILNARHLLYNGKCLVLPTFGRSRSQDHEPHRDPISSGSHKKFPLSTIPLNEPSNIDGSIGNEDRVTKVVTKQDEGKDDSEYPCNPEFSARRLDKEGTRSPQQTPAPQGELTRVERILILPYFQLN
ncbi:hypothetical protein BKA70DRAFT_1408481 [Coprinopsis sp. MPI-PUGE-AT-0042]|nr:hypothetical protein BKA70DRAFT_1408481 [Coprinopsis sp. MPI-PUGE-AT-0042]